MADNRNEQADILSNVQKLADNLTAIKYDKDDNRRRNNGVKNPDTTYLASIDATLKSILQNGSNMSASNAFNSMPGNRSDVSNTFRLRNMNAKGMRKDFTQGFEEALIEAVLGSDFKDKVKASLDGFAEQLGVSLDDIPATLGKELGKNVMNAAKNTDWGSKLFGKLDDLKNTSINQFKERYQSGFDNYIKTKSGQSASKVADATKEAAGSLATGGTEILSSLLAGGEAASAALAGLAAASGPLLIGLAAIVAAVYVLGPALEGLTNYIDKLGNAANREQKSRERNTELAAQRLEADVKTMIEKPFEILEAAAQSLYNAWDQNIRTINGTQGYTKEDLQDLISAYAQRLRDDGLSSVISSADITESLAKVLEAGLSGNAAVEFAYEAAKLNAAIPTQDFYSYSDIYASIAANAIKSGKSQSEAISYANSQLESFASNVLYASRQLSGGFSSGLKNAEELFEKSVKISQFARTWNANEISAVLTSVSAITGAIAPDLANEIVDSIYKAAIGGNSSQLVALRSLAGINASNTEFLKQFAEDPQSVFSTLFRNLSEMQNMSPEAYMEVAEGLSNIFGLSMDSLSRVDFNYLADAISNMQVNSNTLNENMALLKSGETTTNAEQLKMQQINKYMIDEGLAYVMDNEAARAIQQHMWDEQLAREMQESTYGVEIEGAALQFLQGIKGTIDRIMGFLNPLSYVSKIYNVAKSIEEGNALEDDIQTLLEVGKVGKGNALALQQLTTRNKALNLTQDLISLMGGTSAYYTAKNEREASGWGTMSGAFTNSSKLIAGLSGSGLFAAYSIIGSAANQLLYNETLSGINSSSDATRSPNSLYKWGTLGKSAANALYSYSGGTPYDNLATAVSATAESQAQVSANIDKMVSSIPEFAKSKNDDGSYKTYEDWASTAKQYGISNLSAALEDAGYSETDVQEYFANNQATASALDQQARLEKEKQVWDLELEKLPIFEQRMDTIIESLDVIHSDLISSIYPVMDSWFTSWTDYFINHKYYAQGLDLSKVEEIRKSEKSSTDDAINALALALSSNNIDLNDPQTQTNVLLAEILKVLATIMQQNNNKTTSTQLSDTLSALALGLTK